MRLSPQIALVGAASLVALILLARKAGDGGSLPSLGEVRFVPARWFQKGRQGHPVSLFVIHTAETPQTQNAAQNVADYFATTDTKASAHYTVDAGNVVQSVQDEDTAWHAVGANFQGIGIEHAGYAKQTPEEWAGEYSEAMLRRSARLVAGLAQKFGIPVRRLTVAQLLAGESGIAGHNDVNAAFHKGEHTDPGVNFPWEHYLDLVRGGAANA